MCGVAGILTSGNELNDADAQSLLAMLYDLRHRGPDQTGSVIDARVMLGSQRLSMQDLSRAADLPMEDKEAGLVLSFNGEISNFRELSENYKLQQKYSFVSDSDTEVFLKLYRELGIDFLHQLSGMFAFILYDRKNEMVYFGRDFYGINPLFYTQNEGKWYIASEIKALQPHAPHLGLNVQGLADMFTLAYIPGARTPFEAIHEMPAGSYIALNLKTRQDSMHRYFRQEFRPRLWSEEAAIKATREALVESTRRHLHSDAPLGAMCSGGIDTSALIGMAKHLGKASSLHTFSLSIQDTSFDESSFQKIVVKYAGTQHHQINVGLPQIIAHFKEYLAFMDEPYGHGAALPTFLLAQEAQKHVKGLLSGEGGDEWFNAYETHGAHFWKEKYLLLPEFVRTLIRTGVNQLPASHGKLSLDFKLKRFCAGAELPLSESHLYWRHVLKDEIKQELFTIPFESSYRISKECFEHFAENDEFTRLSAWDIEQFFFGDLMVKNDRMCLAHSVESRFPYMDRLVTDLVSTMPSELKMKGSRRRHLQKEAMKPFLPKAIYQRDGFGLELPYNKWFDGALAPLYQNYFTADYFEHFPFLSWDAFSKLWELHRLKHVDVGRFLWNMLILCAWYDINHVSKTAFALREQVRQRATRV